MDEDGGGGWRRWFFFGVADSLKGGSGCSVVEILESISGSSRHLSSLESISGRIMYSSKRGWTRFFVRWIVTCAIFDVHGRNIERYESSFTPTVDTTVTPDHFIGCEGAKGYMVRMERSECTSQELDCADKVCFEAYQVHQCNSLLNGCFCASTEYKRHKSKAMKIRSSSGSVLRKVPSQLDFGKQFLYRNIFVSGYYIVNGVFSVCMGPFSASEMPEGLSGERA